jgi:hypothetical protein
MNAYGPVARLYDYETRIFQFKPDMLIFVGINDLYWSSKEVAEAVIDGHPLPLAELETRARAYGVAEGMDFVVAEAALKPHREELLAMVYRRVVELCAQNGTRAVALYIPRPTPDSPEAQAEIQRQMELAREAGFEVIEILDAYDGADQEGLWIAKWDRHANAKAHHLLAEKLYESLRRELGL